FAGNLPLFAETESCRLKRAARLERGGSMEEEPWGQNPERWERRWERTRRRSLSRLKHVAAGLIVMGIGVIFLLGNLGFVDVHRVVSFWPVILIIFGAVKIVESRHRGRAAGIFWVLIGFLFLLGSLGIIRMTLHE